jgi:flagellar biosynthesis protein FlhB
MWNKLNPEEYSADFEISKRYIDFSAELLRLSIIAITGLSTFFISIIKKGPIPESYNWFYIAIILFALATCSALAHRFFATDCLSYLIAYLRKDSQEEKEGMIKLLKRAEWFLILTEWLFGIAIVVTLIALFSMKPIIFNAIP